MAKYQPGGPVFNKKQTDAMRRLHTTGSMMVTDTEALYDEGGHKRIFWSDTGATIINDEADNPGLTIDASQNVNLEGGKILSVDNIAEKTGDSGVTIDSVILKDGSAAVTHITASGNISGSGTSTLSVGGNITGSGNLEIAGNVSGSGTSTGSFAYVNITSLPTTDPGVAGALFVTGSVPVVDLGAMTGSAQILMVSQGT
jgi:hypothetical protein